jgi:uncharacterized protein YjiS (DUF1127 family)
MFVHDENDFYYNGLASGEWDKARARIIRRAEAARAQALRDLAGVILRPLRIAAWAVAATAGKWWRAYALRRERRRAVRELRALDDRTLRDIGVNRSEIDWVVYGQDETRLRDATIAANRQRCTTATSGTSATPRQSTKPSINKRAA